MELPDNIKIYDIISSLLRDYLETTTNLRLNLYYRRRLPPPTIIVKGKIKYEINKLVRKRRIRKGKG